MFSSSSPLILIGLGILVLVVWRGERLAPRDAQHERSAASAGSRARFDGHRHGGSGCC